MLIKVNKLFLRTATELSGVFSCRPWALLPVELEVGDRKASRPFRTENLLSFPLHQFCVTERNPVFWLGLHCYIEREEMLLLIFFFFRILLMRLSFAIYSADNIRRGYQNATSHTVLMKWDNNLHTDAKISIWVSAMICWSNSIFLYFTHLNELYSVHPVSDDIGWMLYDLWY